VGAFVANMENRHFVGPERRQQINDPRKRFRIVSPFPRSLPLIKRPLYIDDDQCSMRRRHFRF
jgi:hypothetical protein